MRNPLPEEDSELLLLDAAVQLVQSVVGQLARRLLQELLGQQGTGVQGAVLGTRVGDDHLHELVVAQGVDNTHQILHLNQ